MKKLTRKERRGEIRALAAIPDDQIDTSEIPELTDEQLSTAIRGQLYRPRKRPVTIRLDADVLEWLKRDGPGYQTKANRLLRAEMLRSYQKGKPVRSVGNRQRTSARQK